MSGICRSCLKSSRHVYSVHSNSFPVEDLFRLLVPEVCLFTSGEPVICQSCYQLLEMVHKFRAQCLRTEKLINKYLIDVPTTTGIDYGKVKLQDVISYWKTVYYDKPYYSELPRAYLAHLVEDWENGELYVRPANPSEVKTIIRSTFIRPTIKSPVNASRTVKNLPVRKDNFQGNNNDEYLLNTLQTSKRVLKKAPINRDPLMQRILVKNQRLEEIEKCIVSSIDGQKLFSINMPSKPLTKNLSERENNQEPSASTSAEKSTVVEPRIRVRSAESLFEACTSPPDINNTEYCKIDKIGYLYTPKTCHLPSAKEDLPAAANNTDSIQKAPQTSVGHFKIPDLPPIKRKPLKSNCINNVPSSNDVIDLRDAEDNDLNPILPVTTTKACLTSSMGNQLEDIENLVAQFAPSADKAKTSPVRLQGEPRIRRRRIRPELVQVKPSQKKCKKNPKELDRDLYCIPPIECTQQGDYVNDHDYLEGPYDINNMRIKRSKGHACCCLLCDTTQVTINHRGHLRKHDTQCMICEKDFNNVFLLNIHAREHFEDCSSCNKTITYAQYFPHFHSHLSLYDTESKTPEARMIEEGASCENKQQQQTEFSRNRMQSDGSDRITSDDMEFISLADLCSSSSDTSIDTNECVIESPLINHVYLSKPQGDDECQRNKTVILSKDKTDHCESTESITEMPKIKEEVLEAEESDFEIEQVTENKSSSESSVTGNAEETTNLAKSPNMELLLSLCMSEIRKSVNQQSLNEQSESLKQTPVKKSLANECNLEKLNKAENIPKQKTDTKSSADETANPESAKSPNLQLPSSLSKPEEETVTKSLQCSLNEKPENLKETLVTKSPVKELLCLRSFFSEIANNAVENLDTIKTSSNDAQQSDDCQKDDASVKVAPDKSLDKLTASTELGEKVKKPRVIVQRSSSRKRGPKSELESSLIISQPKSLESKEIENISIGCEEALQSLVDISAQNIEQSQSAGNILDNPPQNSSKLDNRRNSNEPLQDAAVKIAPGESLGEIEIISNTVHLPVKNGNDGIHDAVIVQIRSSRKRGPIKTVLESSLTIPQRKSLESKEIEIFAIGREEADSEENLCTQNIKKRSQSEPNILAFQNSSKLNCDKSSNELQSVNNKTYFQMYPLTVAKLSEALQSVYDNLQKESKKLSVRYEKANSESDFVDIMTDSFDEACENDSMLDTEPQPSSSANPQKEFKAKKSTGKRATSKLLCNPKRVNKSQSKRRLVSSSKLPSKVNNPQKVENKNYSAERRSSLFAANLNDALQSFVDSIDEPTPDNLQKDIEPPVGCDSNSNSVNIMNVPPDEILQTPDTGNSSNEPQPSSSAKPQKENTVEKSTGKRVPKLTIKYCLMKRLDNSKRVKKSQNKRKLAKVVPPSKTNNLQEKSVENKSGGRRSSLFAANLNDALQSFVDSIDEATPNNRQKDIEEPPVGCDSNNSSVNILNDPPEEIKAKKSTGKRATSKLSCNPKPVKTYQNKRKLAKFVSSSNPPSKENNLQKEPVENECYSSVIDCIDATTSETLQEDIEELKVGCESGDSKSSSVNTLNDPPQKPSSSESQPLSSANPQKANKARKSTSKHSCKPKRVKKSQSKRKQAKFVTSSNPPSKVNILQEEPVENKNYLGGRRSSLFEANLNDALQSFVDEVTLDNLQKDIEDPAVGCEGGDSKSSSVNTLNDLPDEPQPSSSDNPQKSTGKRVLKLTTKRRLMKPLDNSKRVKKSQNKWRPTKFVPPSNTNNLQKYIEQPPVGCEGGDSKSSSVNTLNDHPAEILQNSSELDDESQPSSSLNNLQKETVFKKLPKRLRRLPKKYTAEASPPPPANPQKTLELNQMKRKSLKQSRSLAKQKSEVMSGAITKQNKGLAVKAKLLKNSSQSQVVSKEVKPLQSALFKKKGKQTLKAGKVIKKEIVQMSGRKRKRGVLELEASNIAVSEEDAPTLKKTGIQGPETTAKSLIEGTNLYESSGSLNLVGLRVGATGYPRRSSRTLRKPRKLK